MYREYVVDHALHYLEDGLIGKNFRMLHLLGRDVHMKVWGGGEGGGECVWVCMCVGGECVHVFMMCVCVCV